MEISHLRASLSTKPEFDIKLLKDNDKLTRFYSAMLTYRVFDSFMTLVEYLEPKAKEMRVWKEYKD